jgi:hypothetical protein
MSDLLGLFGLVAMAGQNWRDETLRQQKGGLHRQKELPSRSFSMPGTGIVPTINQFPSLLPFPR